MWTKPQNETDKNCLARNENSGFSVLNSWIDDYAITFLYVSFCSFVYLYAWVQYPFWKSHYTRVRLLQCFFQMNRFINTIRTHIHLTIRENIAYFFYSFLAILKGAFHILFESFPISFVCAMMRFLFIVIIMRTTIGKFNLHFAIRSFCCCDPFKWCFLAFVMALRRMIYRNSKEHINMIYGCDEKTIWIWI